MNTKVRAVLTAVVIACALGAGASADVLVLKSGQTLEGTVLESGGKVSVVLPYATIAFEKDEVSSITYGPTPIQVYKERAAAIADSDAAGHYELGLYCEQKRLISQARSEYEKAIAADPDHEAARAKLGYVRIEGKWLTYAEYMQARGYVLRKGKFVTAEQSVKLDQRDAAATSEREARNLIRTLAYAIVSSSATASRQAQDRLSGMSDPAALVPLIEQLVHPSPAVRTAVLTAMLNYKEDEAALAVLDVGLYDDAEDIRYQAKVILNRKQNPAAFRAAIDTLSVDDDEMRFRASQALGAIGNPAAIPQLIEYLSWTRSIERNVPTRGRRERNIPPRYVAGIRAKVAPGVVAYEPIMGGFDSSGRRVILDDEYNRREPLSTWSNQIVLNNDALSALNAMTGQDFRFDKNAWRAWYVSNRQRFERPAAAPEAGRTDVAPPRE